MPDADGRESELIHRSDRPQAEHYDLTSAYRRRCPMRSTADNGSAHRGQRSIDRLQGAWSNLKLVHTPVHASWLNQAEIYFSVTQRKVLTPNDFPDLNTLEQQLLACGRRYEQIAAPFEWKFTRPTSTASPNDSTYPPPRPPDLEYVGELPSQSTKRLDRHRAG